MPPGRPAAGVTTVEIVGCTVGFSLDRPAAPAPARRPHPEGWRRRGPVDGSAALAPELEEVLLVVLDEGEQFAGARDVVLRDQPDRRAAGLLDRHARGVTGHRIDHGPHL